MPAWNVSASQCSYKDGWNCCSGPIAKCLRPTNLSKRLRRVNIRRLRTGVSVSTKGSPMIWFYFCRKSFSVLTPYIFLPLSRLRKWKLVQRVDIDCFAISWTRDIQRVVQNGSCIFLAHLVYADGCRQREWSLVWALICTFFWCDFIVLDSSLRLYSSRRDTRFWWPYTVYYNT